MSEPPRTGSGSGRLDAVFRPRSVAIYGASANDSSKLGNVLLRNATASALDEAIAIHPSASMIDGVATAPTLDHRVDLALISVPATAAEAALTDAARHARAGIILSSGFGETGGEGKVVEERLRSIAAAGGMRLIGPNCMGVVSALDNGGFLNGSYFWAIPTSHGPISLISQSGAFGGMFFAELRARNLGLARFASLGNSADVTETDVLEWLGDDEATGTIGIFAEAIRDGRRFVDVARRVTARKPVVILKGGKGRAGARAAASHTGSLAGGHAPARAAFRRAGVIEADGADHFFDLLTACASPQPRPSSNRIAIVTISGGPSVLAADAAERRGLELPSLSPTTVERILALAPPFAATGNPIDLTPQCPPGNFPEAIDAVFDDAAIDGVIAINCGLDLVPFGQGVAAAHRRTGKPTCAFVLDAPGVAAALADAGIPLLTSPERAVDAYTALARGALS